MSDFSCNYKVTFSEEKLLKEKQFNKANKGISFLKQIEMNHLFFNHKESNQT
jgi:hypothetical protein